MLPSRPVLEPGSWRFQCPAVPTIGDGPRKALAGGSTGLARGLPWCFATDVTKSPDKVELRVLGPLEVRVGNTAVPLAGTKQRTLVATLLLRANEVVSVEALIEEIWREAPPPSAPHSLEAYVSRARQLFAGYGPTLHRRGAGYSLELAGATLDASVFSELADATSQAAVEGEHERAARLATEALALWHGPVLSDVTLGPAGRAEAERLEERRLRTLELRFDAELALGTDDELVGELQLIVGQNPYRERFVAQLMLALYRSGRHAEALDVYERMRAALAADLGLLPSEELQQLSGRIVRQEPELRRPVTPRLPGVRRGARRTSRALIAGAVAAAVVAVSASGAAPRADTQAPASTIGRVALVLPSSTRSSPPSAVLTRTFEKWARDLVIDTETFVTDGPSAASVGRRLAEGEFDVVISGHGTAAQTVAPLVGSLDRTKFVFVDVPLEELSLDGVANATAVRFADDQTSHLVGYLSGLVSPRGAAPRERADMVSVVAGVPGPRTRHAVAAFTRGARRALPDVEVRVDYTNDVDDRTACERLANDQVDAGSDVVFALAGRCGLGAMAVARLRGVWAIGTEDDDVGRGPHVLATTYKDWESSIRETMLAFVTETLPAGKEIVLGLEDDYAVGIVRTSYTVDEAVWSKVVERCSQLRLAAAGDPA